MLNGEEVVFDFSTVTHSYSANCPTLYFFLEHRRIEDYWEPFLEDQVKVEGSSNKVTVRADYWDVHLEEETYRFRIGVAAVSNLSTAQYPAYLELNITFIKACITMKLELLGSYNLLESSVLADDDGSVSFPGAQLKPYP